MIYLCQNSNTQKDRSTLNLLHSLGTEYSTLDLLARPLPEELFYRMLAIVGDTYKLINTTKYHALINDDVNLLDDFTISELYQFLKDNPRVLKGPILIDTDKNVCVTGFNKDKIRDNFKPRVLKRREQLVSLNIALTYEKELQPYDSF